MFTITELTEKINRHFEELKFTRQPQGLYAPVSYVLSIGGKRIRPLLMLMAYNLYREDVEHIFPQATGIEVYHNYTLLHDDLMDKADRRRASLPFTRYGMRTRPSFPAMRCWYWPTSSWRNVLRSA